MKDLKLSLLFCIGSFFFSNAQDEFIFKIETTTNDQVFTIPADGTGINYNVDWGDTNSDANVTSSIPHTYTTPGEYTITITGSLPWFRVNNNPDIRDMILSVEQWGANQWQSMQGAFYGCSKLVINAADAPDLSMATSLESTFDGCSSLQNPDLSGWDISNITTLRRLFRNATNFNGNITTWDVGRVTLFAFMFDSAVNFNQDISGWNIGEHVTGTINMAFSFVNASEFNQPIGSWDMSKVINTSHMFSQATKFNQPLSNWDVSNITNMVRMFSFASDFNQDLGNWDISSVTNITLMLEGLVLSIENYDNTLIGWATLDAGETQIPINLTLAVNNLNYCLGETAREDLINTYNWTISGDNLFCSDSFITTWQTTAPNETITIPTVNGETYNYSIAWGDASPVEFVNNAVSPSHQYASAGVYTVTITGVFPRIRFANTGDKDKILSIEEWGNSVWTSMAEAFQGCSNLVLNATDTPDLSSVDTMQGMFSSATNFADNGGAMGNWDVSNVTLMNGMFSGASDFNQDLSNWDVSNVTLFNSMFNGANSFDQSLGNWDISSATSLNNMLNGTDLSIANYDATLIGWATLDAGETQIPTNITLDADGLSYCNSTVERTTLANTTFNWTFRGDFIDCNGFFTTTWQTTSDNEAITIPTNSLETYDYTIFWGDGEFDTNITGDISHTYSSAGTYTVRITGNFSRIYFNNTGDKDNILSIEQWGTIEWSSMESAFYGCSNLRLLATDAPNLSMATSLEAMFRDCSSLQSPDLSNWDVSNITIMSRLFDAASNFNGNVTAWDIGNVTNFSRMFDAATSFNQNISGWNIGENVTGDISMFLMFLNATNFNQPIGSWDMSKVTNTAFMFANAPSFNQPLDNWVVSNVTIMQGMFSGASDFNQTLGDWNISSVTDMEVMLEFSGLSTENYDATLIGWATLDPGETLIPTNITIAATNLNYCLGETAREDLINTYNWTINGDSLNCSSSFITTWETTSTNETITIPTFSGEIYNYVIDWGDGSPIESTTSDASPSHQYANTDIYTITIGGVFPRIFFNNTGDKDKILSVEQWGNIEWSSMARAFHGCSNLVLNATDIPDLSMANTMQDMFNNATNFVDNGGAIGNWDVSTINNMFGLFQGLVAFNSNINNWDVSNVSIMGGMFGGNLAFNQQLDNWDVSNVTEMNGMFFFASSFNQDLSSWDVSNVMLFNEMFNSASSFNQSLGSWDISSATTLGNMLNSTNLSVDNYDATLIGWATLDSGETQIPTNISLGVVGLSYCNSATERNTLISAPFNWTFRDDSLDCTTLSNEDITAINGLSAYPNPVSNILYINDAGQYFTKIEVFNVNGQKVYTKTTNLDQIDMQTFNAGLYLFKLYTSSAFKILKVIKE